LRALSTLFVMPLLEFSKLDWCLILLILPKFEQLTIN
jgi:hypothetical protein